MATNDVFLDIINPNYFVDKLPTLETGTDSLPFFAADKFPNVKKEVTKLQFIKGYKDGSRLAPLAEYDADYSRKGRKGFSQITEEIPFFRFAKPLTEEEMMQIDAAYSVLVSSGSSEAIKSIMEEIYNDEADLVRDIRKTQEFLRFQVLQNNGINITSTDYGGNVVKYQASFDVPGDATWASTHNIAIANAWEKDTSTPLVDILDAIQQARKINRTVISEILPSERLYNALLNNKNDRDQFATISAITPAILTADDAQRWLTLKLGGTNIIIHNPYNYDNQYIDYQGNTQTLLNDNTCLLLPKGQIGKTVLAPTPAERNKTRNPESRVAITEDRIAVHNTVIEDKEPFSYDTVVSATTVPSGEGMDSVFKLTVAAPTN
ncbi:MAG: major capsid protein [Bifidobacteriaceae bacterium]|nr:major capsid protein [Bifidobacteriaceae bacterium]